jgi:hypothetical protein
MLTTTLNSGHVVLAKMYKGEPSALTYANRTQAEKAALATLIMGTNAKVIRSGRPWYVSVDAE